VPIRPRLRCLTLALALALPGAAPAFEGSAGAYLAGRHASGHSDYRAAASYYTRALIEDPRNVVLMDNAILGFVGEGAVARAVPIAMRLEGVGGQSQMAALVMLAETARRGDWEKVVARLDEGTAVGPLVLGLARAWALLGEGRMSEAAGAFDDIAEGDGLQSFALYHKALALASVGDFEGADAILGGEAGGPIRATRRGVLTHAQVLSQLERNADAIELIDAVFGANPDAAIAAVRADLEAGQTLPFDTVRNAQDGLAEVFFTVASALNGESSDTFTLVYVRLSEFLRPDFVDALLLAADILETQGQFDLATEAYNKIPPGAPAYPAAELGRADALVQAGRLEAAIEVLDQLTRSHPDLMRAWANKGDVLRRAKRYAESARAYDEAIARLGAEEPGHWFLYYARGIAHEREKEWPEAEADFRKALDLSPDQPQVLNYLGYSFLEMQTNLEEALEMIERAVKARPDSGHIVDSLGWAYYRLGRYDEAVEQMERAIELMPSDSIVNDHLGDVYWAVGRKREAEFQWRRALSFEPETEEEAARIRRKLDVGLDVVLEEEGAPPLKVVNDDG